MLLALVVPALLTAWVWLFPDRRPTPMLVIGVSSYESPCPPNAFAVEDVERFERTFADYDNLKLTVPDEPGNRAELLATVDKFLSSVRPGGPDKNVAIIYLSAHGVVNSEGKPCLLLPADSPLDSRTWMPIADLLEALGKTHEGNAFKTIVMLDANRIDDAWQMGVIVNTFSAALERLLATAPPKDCVVLTAASSLQAAAASPELGATPFGYFAALALRGEADENRDAYVTLAELDQYLGERVGDWTWRYRGVRQIPKRLTSGDDALRLADVAGDEQVPEQSWKPPISPPEFKQVLDRAVKLEESRVLTFDPVGWAKVQSLLERLDAEALAGKAYQSRARESTLRALLDALSELESERPFRDMKPLSLAMRERLDEAPPASLEPLWKQWLEKPAETKVTVGYDSAAEFTWSQLAQGDGTLSEDDLGKALQFCDLAGKPPREEYEEIALLRLLERYADWSSGAMPGGIPRQLLVARKSSEQLATPDDPRQHYVVAGHMAPLDESLATAFDQTIVGNDESLVQVDRRLGTLLGGQPGGYRPLADLSAQVLRALRARDQALAAAVYLNEWCVHRGRHDPGARTNLDAQPLVRDALQLAAYLDEIMGPAAQGNPQETATRLTSLTANVESSLQRLVQTYSERIEAVTVEKGGSQAGTAVETPDLLRCPVRLSDGWLRLHENWIERLTEKSAAPAPGETADDSADSAAELDYLRWLATDGLRPLRQILDDPRFGDGAAPEGRPSSATRIDRESTRAEVDLALAELGGRVRERLSGLAAQCRQLADLTTEQFAEHPASVSRLGLSHSDVLCRSLAPLAVGTLRFKQGEAPAELLQKLDAQAWVLWQGRRAVDDCWGNWQPTSTAAEPYFVRVAALAANDAEELLPESRYGADDLRTRTQRMDELVRSWRPLAPKDLPVVDEGSGFKRFPLAFQGAPQMRAGQVAVYLTDEANGLFKTYNRNSREVRRTSAEMGKDALLDAWLSIDSLGNIPTLTANALFRGHLRPAGFSIGQGVLVEWQKPAAADASVVVRGDSKQVSQIVFIFDCSGSMSRGNRDRIKEGREVLSRILGRLIDQGEQFRVGLVVFGRRAGWKDGPNGSYVADRLTGSTFNGLPRDDVEIPFRPAPLNKNLAGAVNEFLKGATPRGETPLYFALTAALQTFDRNTPGSRHIIAITDGVDDITVEPGTARAAKYNRETVVKELAGLPTRIDIVEFGVDAAALKPREREFFPAGRAALKELAESEDSHGSWQAAQQTADLEQALLDSLRLDRYRLQARGTPEPTTPRYQEFGTWAVIRAPLAPTDYLVQLQSLDAPPAEIQVEGGEALELIYRRTPVNHLVNPIYEAAHERGKQVAGGLRVAAHTPKLLVGREPIFRFSIQTGDEQRFSRRPEVIWARVEPLDAGVSRNYFFFDREFEPGLPVPMLDLRARGWLGSKFARAEIAFAMDADALPPTWFSIPRLGADQFESHGATLRAKSELVGGGFQVVIDEEHPENSPDYPLHLQLDPLPDSVSRTFFESNHSVRHVFRYSVEPASPKLRVLTRREIEAGGGAAVFDRIELPRR